MKNSEIQRRDLLKTAGAGAFALAASQLSGRVGAQTAPSAEAVTAFYRAQLGDYTLTVVSDGTFEVPAGAFAVNQPEGAVDRLLGRNGLPLGPIDVPIANLLVQTGERTVLFDAGFGDFRGLGENVGKLVPSLALLGTEPGDVTDLVLSHLHPDHVGGVSSGGRLVFANARHYFPQAEWDFINGPATGDETVDGLIDLARAKLTPALEANLMTFYSGDDELAPGVQALATPGHTPGHHSFLVSSAGDRLIVTSDAFAHPLAPVQHPDWLFGFDALPEETVASRRTLFGRAADEGVQTFSNHFPFPGLGYVTREGNAFRFQGQS